MRRIQIQTWWYMENEIEVPDELDIDAIVAPGVLPDMAPILTLVTSAGAKLDYWSLIELPQ